MIEDVLLDDPSEMVLVENDEVVEAFSAEGSDYSLWASPDLVDTI